MITLYIGIDIYTSMCVCMGGCVTSSHDIDVSNFNNKTMKIFHFSIVFEIWKKNILGKNLSTY